MYWPTGTPRIYATSSNRASEYRLFVSYDGVSGSAEAQPEPVKEEADDDDDGTPPPTPATPAIKSVEFSDGLLDSPLQTTDQTLPLKDPVLALRVSRSGAMFAVITATSITLWQTKVCCVAA